MKKELQTSHAVGMLMMVSRKVCPWKLIFSSGLPRFFSFLRFLSRGFSACCCCSAMNSFINPRKALTPIVTEEKSWVLSELHTVFITCKQRFPISYDCFSLLKVKQLSSLKVGDILRLRWHPQLSRRFLMLVHKIVLTSVLKSLVMC